MTVFFALLRVWWKPLLLVGVVVGAWLYVDHLRTTIVTQAGRIEALTNENKIITDNNKKLVTAIGVTNEVVGKMGSGSDLIKKNFEALVGNVRAQNSNLEARMKQMWTERKPQNCDETIQYLINAVPEYKK